MKTRPEIEGRVATTRATLDRARTELTEARRAYLEAESLYIDKGTKGTLERKRDAGDEVERREALERRADDAHQAAQVELAQLDREDALVRLELLKAKLASHLSTVEHHAGEFVALDRAVEGQVMALAVQVRDAVDTYNRAESLANELRQPLNLGPRPDLANASLAVRRAVSAARRKEDRDALAPHWLSDAPDAHDYRLRGTTAEEVVDIARGASTARQHEHHAAAFRAGFAAAQVKPAPIITTTTETPDADQ